jgi:hypothetical protein
MPLHAVAINNDNVADDNEPRTLADAVADGTELELLELALARVATALDDPKCPAPAIASLTRRLQDLRKDIAAMRAASVEEGNGPADSPDTGFDAAAI